MSVRDAVLDKIRELVKLEGSNVDFAKKVGTSKQAVGNWIKGANAPDIEMIAKIAKAYGIPLSEMLSSDVTYAVVDLNKEQQNDFVLRPVMGEIAAGTSIEMTEIIDNHPCPKQIADKHPNSGWLRVEGDSYNRSIPNGCYALIDFDLKEPNEHSPFAVCVNGYSATINSFPSSRAHNDHSNTL